MKKLSLLLLTLFLVGCTTRWDRVATQFSYGQKVDIVSGFYKDQSGAISERIGWCYEDTHKSDGLFDRDVITMSIKYKVTAIYGIFATSFEVCAHDMKLSTNQGDE